VKTIAEFVEQGINNLPELQAALQTAMQLEFSTIPPYLCAEWSIQTDPAGVGGMIHDIVVQEMFHFALAGNMLSAINGNPSIASAGFLPTYPTTTLPGKIPLLDRTTTPPTLATLTLLPLSLPQVQIFMDIEYPESTPVALVATAPATIGGFYDTIVTAFSDTVKPQISASAPFISWPQGKIGQIASITDAIAAITRIKTEGEGTKGSPDEPLGNTLPFAHYYTFKEIHEGKKLVQDPNTGKWSFTGDPIAFPTAIHNAVPATQPNPDQTAFSNTLLGMLQKLQACWTASPPPISSIIFGDMFSLKESGIKLFQQLILPEFVLPSSS
jgi:hypothetical protein